MKITLKTLGSGYFSTQLLNANFQAIAEAIESCLFRGAIENNSLLTDIDMNNNGLYNVGFLSVSGNEVDLVTLVALYNELPTRIAEVLAIKDQTETLKNLAENSAILAQSQAVIATQRLAEVLAHLDITIDEAVDSILENLTGELDAGALGGQPASYYAPINNPHFTGTVKGHLRGAEVLQNISLSTIVDDGVYSVSSSCLDLPVNENGILEVKKGNLGVLNSSNGFIQTFEVNGSTYKRNTTDDGLGGVVYTPWKKVNFEGNQAVNVLVDCNLAIEDGVYSFYGETLEHDPTYGRNIYTDLPANFPDYIKAPIPPENSVGIVRGYMEVKNINSFVFQTIYVYANFGFLTIKRVKTDPFVWDPWEIEGEEAFGYDTIGTIVFARIANGVSITPYKGILVASYDLQEMVMNSNYVFDINGGSFRVPHKFAEPVNSLGNGTYMLISEYSNLSFSVQDYVGIWKRVY